MSNLFAVAVNTPAKAKIVFNKKLGTVRVVVAFNVGDKFPAQRNCAFVSGDLMQEDVPRVLAQASTQLNTTNIEIV
jgi:hypothetical protein